MQSHKLGEAMFDEDDIFVGERSGNSKFSTHHQDQSMEFTSNEREGVHLHTLVDRERKRCKNADEVVVLVAIQIVVDSDLSAEPRRLRVQHTCSPVTSPAP